MVRLPASRLSVVFPLGTSIPQSPSRKARIDPSSRNPSPRGLLLFRVIVFPARRAEAVTDACGHPLDKVRHPHPALLAGSVSLGAATATAHPDETLPIPIPFLRRGARHTLRCLFRRKRKD